MSPAFILLGPSSHRTIHLCRARLFFSEASNGELVWRTSRFLSCLAHVEVHGDIVWLLSSTRSAPAVINGMATASPTLLRDMDIVQLAGHALAYVESSESLNGSTHYGLLRRLKDMATLSATSLQ